MKFNEVKAKLNENGYQISQHNEIYVSGAGTFTQYRIVGCDYVDSVGNYGIIKKPTKGFHMKNNNLYGCFIHNGSGFDIYEDIDLFISALTEHKNLKSGTYLIQIIKPLAYLSPDKVVQQSTYNDKTKRFYINKGATGYVSIGLKSVKILKKIN